MIDRYLTVAEAAERLGVSRRRVQALIERRQVKAVRAGNRWMIAVDEVDRRARTNPGRGRTVRPENAWVRLQAGLLTSVEQEQLAHAMRSIGDRHIANLKRAIGDRHIEKAMRASDDERDRWRRTMRRRAEHIDGYAHPAVVNRLLDDPNVVVSGRHAADHAGIPVGASDDEVHLYLRPSMLGELRERGLLDEAASSPNLYLHVIGDDRWPFSPTARFVPPLVAWLDLADEGDRSERLVREYLMRTST